MRLGNVARDGGTRLCLRVDDETVLDAPGSIEDVLADPPAPLAALARTAPAAAHRPLAGLELAAPVPRPSKIIGVGLNALGAVLGYLAVNDVSARDVQHLTSQWTLGKSFDTFAPTGPLRVTADEIPDPQALEIITRVNGDEMQHSNTKHMLFGVADPSSELSHYMTLLPGDIIATGTPAGVGGAQVPPRFLGEGDVVEVDIENIGVLRNPVGR